MRRPQAGPGDFLVACNELAAGQDATRRAIAELLGLDFVEPQPLRPEVQPLPPQPVTTLPAAGPEPEPAEEAAKPVEVHEPAAVPFEVHETGVRKTELQLGEFEEFRPTPDPPPPKPEPLLTPNWTRAIAGALVSQVDPYGPLDTERIVEESGRGRALTQLPRRTVFTQRSGVYVLLDAGDAMLPFREDQTQFIAALRRILPDELVRVYSFMGSPSSGRHPRWRAFRPPDGEIPVLLLTDLGIGRPELAAPRATMRDWTAFARGLTQPPLALVPYGRRRWPGPLAAAYRIVHWDRGTSAGAVLRLLRRNRP